MKKIIVAGGCFWGVEHYYKRLKGILDTTVGYIDGIKENPSYEEVCQSSGHAEAVLIQYDESVISLEKIVEHFFRIVNPTELNFQSHDMGIQYRNGFYVFNEEDKKIIKELIEKEQGRYKNKIVTFVKDVAPFYDAEKYHQDYLDKHPLGYCHINMAKAKPEELK